MTPIDVLNPRLRSVADMVTKFGLQTPTALFLRMTIPIHLLFSQVELFLSPLLGDRSRSAAQPTPNIFGDPAQVQAFITWLEADASSKPEVG